LNPVFARPAAEAEIAAVRRTHDLPGRFLLFVGATEPRKNLPALVDALALAGERIEPLPLVIVGRRGGDHEALLRRIDEKRMTGRVRLLGYLDDESLRGLYNAATALIFPSLGEGFGLPLLEAMACALPAAVSGVAALPEVGADAAVYFRPDDPLDMASAIVRILNDEPLRATLRSRGPARARLFGWERTARIALDFYREVVGRT
jgi:alpha-1,3-rhamnosyl/mannosyltransferase